MYEQIEELYLAYYPELYRFLLGRCGNRDIIDDIIQSTFLEALKSSDRFQGTASIKTWLFSIAKHQLFQYFRKNKQELDIEQINEGELYTEHDFSDRIFADQVLNKINELNAPHNEILRLRLIFGLSFREIGLRVGQTENYCRVNFYRIKERLRKENAYE